MDDVTFNPEESPVATGQWDGSWDGSPMQTDLGGNNPHAMNATTAAFHADIAAKHAAQLAQYVSLLSGTLNQLQNKVTELESWKATALVDVRNLRDEHKALKQKVLEKESSEMAQANASSSTQPLDRFAPGSPGPPPGLDSSPSIRRDDTTDTLMSESGTATSGGISSGLSSLSLPDPDGPRDDGVVVTQSKIDDVDCQHAEWRVANLSMKLRSCMGRALVSTSFSAFGMDDLRLMIYPDSPDVALGRTRRTKELYAKKISEGPLDGCLSLKIPNCSEDCCQLRCYYTVGSQRRGPFTHNFTECTVSKCEDFGVDWLKELGPDQSLIVAVDIMHEPSAKP